MSSSSTPSYSTCSFTSPSSFSSSLRGFRQSFMIMEGFVVSELTWKYFSTAILQRLRNEASVFPSYSIHFSLNSTGPSFMKEGFWFKTFSNEKDLDLENLFIHYSIFGPSGTLTLFFIFYLHNSINTIPEINDNQQKSTEVIISLHETTSTQALCIPLFHWIHYYSLSVC